MREIKFRGKMILFEREGWAYGHLLRRDIDTGRVFIREYNIENAPPRYTDYEVDPATTTQFTGVKDADGTEIYEGDIVRYGVSVHRPEYEIESTVVFYRGGWKLHPSVTGGYADLAFGDIFHGRVIGNKFDSE